MIAMKLGVGSRCPSAAGRSGAVEPGAPCPPILADSVGLIPFWAKDANIGYKMINARAETVAEKSAFRGSVTNPQ
jgi:hypothetical protein